MHLPGVWNSRDILEWGGQNFDSLIIIGGGVVGVECATLYRCLGCEVTVLEAADHILPFMDKEIAQRLTMILKKQGVTVEAKANVQKIEGTPGAMTVSYVDKKGIEQTVTAKGVLAAAGRKANLDGLFGPDFSLELERGAIVGRRGWPHQRAPRLCHRRRQSSEYPAGPCGQRPGRERSGSDRREETAPGYVCGAQLRLYQPGDRLGGSHRRGGQDRRHPREDRQIPHRCQRKVPH